MWLAHKKSPAFFNLTLLISVSVINCCIKNTFISSILLFIGSVSLFKIILSIELKDSIVYPFLRKMSTVIYFIHLYVWTFYYTIFYGEKATGMICFIATSAISMLLAFIYVYYTNKYKSKNFIIRKSV